MPTDTTLRRPKASRPDRLPRLLVSHREAARMLGLSVASFYRRLAAGEIGPTPLSLGGRRLFEVSSLKRFVRLGLPPRDQWTALETARKAAKR